MIKHVQSQLISVFGWQEVEHDEQESGGAWGVVGSGQHCLGWQGGLEVMGSCVSREDTATTRGGSCEGCLALLNQLVWFSELIISDQQDE